MSVERPHCLLKILNPPWRSVLQDSETAVRFLEDLNAMFKLERIGPQRVKFVPRTKESFYDEVASIGIDIKLEGSVGVGFSVEHTCPLTEQMKRLVTQCIVAQFRSMCEQYDQRFSLNGQECNPRKTLRMVMLATSMLCVGTLSGTNPLRRLEPSSD